MIAISIEELFTNERLPKGWSLVPIFFYFPLGVVLVTIRFFIGIHALLVACLLPKTTFIRSYVLRTMCFVLGILVNEESKKHKNSSAKIIVTNHVTILDHLAIDLVLPCIVPCIWDLPQVLTWCLGYKDLGISAGRDVLIQNAQRHCRESNLPIFAHPEGATTNGSVGLLKFNTWPFCIGQPVCPVIIEVKRLFFLNISPSVIGSRWWSDMFWFLFSPCTIFTVKYLPEMRYDKDISVEDFTKQVQEAMASGLNVKATNYTCADKKEYLKKVTFNHTRNEFASNSSERNSQLLTMIHQVKEVLPTVPVDTIKLDLLQTDSVSLTISNLLEGVVQYVPEIESPNTQLSSASTSNVTPTSSSNSESLLETDSFNTAASSFGKTASERMLSYKERKNKLIENARNRYLAKQASS